MVKKPVKYVEMGARLRVIRQQLKLTLEVLRKEVGVSASYISDFERGIKLPTAKYLRHLHDNYHVCLDYVFGSRDTIFRRAMDDKEPLDFGKFKEEVDEMMTLMSEFPHALYAMLLKFSEYKVDNRDYISKINRDD